MRVTANANYLSFELASTTSEKERPIFEWQKGMHDAIEMRLPVIASFEFDLPCKKVDQTTIAASSFFNLRAEALGTYGTPKFLLMRPDFSLSS